MFRDHFHLYSVKITQKSMKISIKNIGNALKKNVS